MGATAETPPPDPLVQMNVRVPQSVRDAIDDRRKAVGARTGRRISRDRWVTNAARFALQQPQPEGKRTR